MARYCRLARRERYQIEVLLKRGDGVRAIALALNRSPSTISRELRRNGDPLVYRAYWATAAEERTQRIRHRDRAEIRLIDSDSEMKSRIRECLSCDWSPEQISGSMRRRKWGFYASYSTIYRFIYRDALYGGDLWKKLRKPRKKRMRMQYLKYRPNQGKILNRVFIEHRPKVIEKRARRGDWERDTVRGSKHEPVILSIVDRKSRLTRLALLEKKSSRDVHLATVRLLHRDPHVKSVTNDNGREFSWHEETSESLRRPIFFTHPHCSWERGTNENTNGLIRQYFPKGSDFSKLTQAQVQAVEDLLNQRPRKCLEYKTPYEAHYG